MFVPKYHRGILVGRIKQRLALLIQAYTDQHHVKILAMEIMPDHVHLCLSTPPSISASQIVMEPKVGRVAFSVKHSLS
ncbi:MAG: IS200/IS605 family transposase [Candidatus Hermodarchaeota archaeon]